MHVNCHFLHVLVTQDTRGTSNAFDGSVDGAKLEARSHLRASWKRLRPSSPVGPAERRPPVDSITLYEKRGELHRVLQSRHFAKAKKKSRFLEFICEQTFLGNAEKLNEYLIGVEVYERGPDFDPQEDPIVRVQAHEIRRALRQFYEEDGKDSAYRLDLPPGH